MKIFYNILGKSGQNGFILSAILLLFFSFFPTIYEATQGGNIQKGRELVLEHGWTPDFNLYLSKMRQGAEGRWTAVELYTNEEHKGSLVQIFYLLLGKVGSGVGLSIVATYHLARLVFGAWFLFMIYLFAVRLFPGSLWALVAFWLSITVSSWPIWKLSDLLAGKFWYGSFMSWWTILDPLRRMTVMPHLLAGQALLVVVVYLFFYREDKGDGSNRGYRGEIKKRIVLGSLGLAMGFIFPPVLLMAYVVVWGMVTVKIAYRSYKTYKTYKQVIQEAVIFTALSLPSLFYLGYVTSFYPWKRLVEINLLEPLHFPIYEFALALGPVLMLAVFGVFISIWKKKAEFWPMAVWIGGIFALMIAVRRIPSQNALRFTEVGHFVPVGMLAAGALRWLSHRSYRTYKTYITAILLIAVIGLGLGHMGQSLYWQLAFIRQRVIATMPDVARFPQVMYPWREFMDAIRWLEKNTAKDAVIFSDETFGSYIPPYSGRRVYCCHANTPQKEERLGKVWAFYQGQRGDKDTVYQWLNDLAIGYVMFGPQEKEVASMAKVDNISKIYPFLTVVYQDEKVTIYRVSPRT